MGAAYLMSNSPKGREYCSFYCSGYMPRFPGGSDGNASAYSVGDLGSIPGSGRSFGEGNSNPVLSLVQGDPLEKEIATHSSTFAWKIPWTEEHSRLQSMGLQRVGHD